jgi:hypothetical protein
VTVVLMRREFRGKASKFSVLSVVEVSSLPPVSLAGVIFIRKCSPSKLFHRHLLLMITICNGHSGF